MENAVKALIIAAGVLIGVMILSLGVTIYSSLSGYVENIAENAASKELQQFNQPYIKNINWNEEKGTTEFTLSIHDIVTIANIARESNLDYNLTEQDENTYYVTVNLLPDNENLEKTINSNMAEILDKGLGKKYRCSSNDVKFNMKTGRVNQIDFHILD